MSRLKDADALIEKLQHIEQPSSTLNGIGLEPLIAIRTVCEMVQAMPTVDAEPVRHGRYVGTEFDGYSDGNPVYYEWKCSECECVFEDEYEEPRYKYCPNCGAKMDGGEQE